MLFHVQMDVRLPHDLDGDKADELKRVERDRADALQKEGKWRHLWRVAGRYSNVSVFDVADAQELHDLVSTLPLFPFMDIVVTPLCRHPSSIHEEALEGLAARLCAHRATPGQIAELQAIVKEMAIADPASAQDPKRTRPATK